MVDKMSLKEWADRKYREHRQEIEFYIAKGITRKEAYCMVMNNSNLGAGYKAQMRRDFGLTMFD